LGCRAGNFEPPGPTHNGGNGLSWPEKPGRYLFVAASASPPTRRTNVIVSRERVPRSPPNIAQRFTASPPRQGGPKNECQIVVNVVVSDVVNVVVSDVVNVVMY
jgi:hypothetical protein